jgi:hypothetical protein
MSVALYELTNNYTVLLSMIQDSDVPSKAMLDTLDSIQDALNVKVEGIGKMLRMLDADVEILKAEEKRLADRRKAIENKQKQIKEYVRYQLEAAGFTEIKSPLITVKVQTNPPAVEITNRDAIPRRFIKTTIVEDVDKNAIKEAIKDGQEVPGAILLQGKSLRIK